jgi:hypothetical protein
MATAIIVGKEFYYLQQSLNALSSSFVETASGITEAESNQTRYNFNLRPLSQCHSDRDLNELVEITKIKGTMFRSSPEKHADYTKRVFLGLPNDVPFQKNCRH